MIAYLIGDITEQSTERVLRSPAEAFGGSTTLLISSSGGRLDYMLALYDWVERQRITTLSTGVVQSAAAVLSQAGAQRLATPNTLFRFIAPEPAPGEEKVDDLRWYMHSSVVNLVAKRLGLSEVIEAYDIFDGDFITAQRALELNLIDGIVGGANDSDRS